MIYAGIDVNIINHEKALTAGIEAFGLWCWGMCYAQIHETDGRLARVAVMSALGGDKRALRRAAVRLVTSGLWIESDDGSFQVWNYTKKNRTASEIEGVREDRKAANAARQRDWRSRRNAGVTRDSNADVTPRNGPTVTTPSLHCTAPIGTDVTPVTPEPVAPKSRRRAETPCPPSGASAGELRDWCEGWKIPIGHGELIGFLDHHRKSDARWRDWAAAWRTWLKNASRFAARGARGAEATKQPFDPDAPWMKLPEVG